MKDKCSFCNTTLKSIKESGFVGCEHCYSEIDQLSKLVEKLFDGKSYRGKIRRQDDELF